VAAFTFLVLAAVRHFKGDDWEFFAFLSLINFINQAYNMLMMAIEKLD
jgi:hypothetical protein